MKIREWLVERVSDEDGGIGLTIFLMEIAAVLTMNAWSLLQRRDLPKVSIDGEEEEDEHGDDFSGFRCARLLSGSDGGLFRHTIIAMQTNGFLKYLLDTDIPEDDTDWLDAVWLADKWNEHAKKEMEGEI